MQIKNVSEIAFFQWSISSYSGNKPQPKSVDETKFNEKKLEKKDTSSVKPVPNALQTSRSTIFRGLFWTQPAVDKHQGPVLKSRTWNCEYTIFCSHFPSNYFWVKIFYRHLNCKRTNDLNESMGDKPPPFLRRTTSTADIGHFSMDKMSSREHYCCARRNPKTNAWTRLSPLILAQQRSCGGGVCFFLFENIALAVRDAACGACWTTVKFFYWAYSDKCFHWDPTSK